MTIANFIMVAVGVVAFFILLPKSVRLIKPLFQGFEMGSRFWIRSRSFDSKLSKFR